MEGDISSPKLAKFDVPNDVTHKLSDFQRQLADLEEHCKLLKTSMSRDRWRKKIKDEDEDGGQGEMQMSTYDTADKRIQDYYCITQGVSERDGVSDARRLAEDTPPRVDISSPSASSSEEEAAGLVSERSEKLTLFINPLSDIGEQGTSEDHLSKSCALEVSGQRRSNSSLLERNECHLSVSAMAAEEGDSAIGTPHPYLQRTSSFTFPELHSPSEETCNLFQASREKPVAPLMPPMGRVHVRVSNSDSQGEDFWEFDTCTSDLESVSLTPSSADSHSPRFGNSSTATYSKNPLTVTSSSLGRSKSDRYLNVENWSLDQTSGTSSNSVNETLDLKELRPGRKPRRTVAATLRPPEMTVFLKEEQQVDTTSENDQGNAETLSQKTNKNSEFVCENEDLELREELTLYVPVISSDSDNMEEHESIILSISPSDKSDVIDTAPKQVKKCWHQCIKDTVINTIKSVFCTVEEDHDLEDLDMQTVRYKPEGLDTLCRATKFNRKELQLMYRGFKQECPSGVVNEETFKNIYSQFFPQGDSSRYAHFVFNSFDTDHNGSLTFEEFVSGLSILARGTVNEKLNWAFNLYDINGDGYITREEMLSVVQAIYDMMGKYSEPTAEDITPSEHVERVFQKMDVNGDGVVSIEEFIDCCKKDETITRSMHVFDTIL